MTRTLSSGQARHVTGSRIVGAKIPTVTGARTALDSRIVRPRGRGAEIGWPRTGSTSRPVRAMRAAARQPSQHRSDNSRMPAPYSRSAARGQNAVRIDGVPEGLGDVQATWAVRAGGAGEDASPVVVPLTTASPSSSAAMGSNAASSGANARGSDTGIAIAGTPYGRSGMRSIAHRTAVHDAWRTRLERTRSAPRIAATSSETTDTLSEASASSRSRMALMGSPFAICYGLSRDD